MKKVILDILEKYLQIFPDEYQRQVKLIEYLDKNDDNDITDWNNFDGHIVAGGFIYAKKDEKFLVLYHKDLKMYLYPGGHMDSGDKNPLEASKREILEETGLRNLKQLKLNDDELIPVDIDTQVMRYNERLKLPEHYHFDFRYLFVIDKIGNINIDAKELANYKWINITELKNNFNYGKISSKIEKMISNQKSKRS